MAAVTFRLDEDGKHFWWGHDCEVTRKMWSESGKTDPETVERFARGDLYPSMLPLGGDGWTVISKEPLTIVPSILCSRCGVHGWIRNGEWVNA
jgi:hypothetical protein